MFLTMNILDRYKDHFYCKKRCFKEVYTFETQEVLSLKLIWILS